MPSIREPGKARPAAALRIGPAGVERRTDRVRHAEPGRVPAVAHVSADGRAGATGSGGADHPPRLGKPLPAELGEDRLGDVVVAAPVGGPLGVGELVHVVAVATGREPAGLVVDRAGGLDQVAAAALALDQPDLVGRRAGRHHRDERQPEHAGEIGLGHRGRAGRRLDHRGALGQPAVAQRIQEQGSGQAVLQRAGDVGRLVLEIEIDAPVLRQREPQQMGVGAALRLRLDPPHRAAHPVALARREPIQHDGDVRAAGGHRPTVAPGQVVGAALLSKRVDGLDHLLLGDVAEVVQAALDERHRQVREAVEVEVGEVVDLGALAAGRAS